MSEVPLINSGAAKANQIEAEWLDYFRKVLSHPCSEVQELECKRAFFGGAFIGLKLVYQVSNVLPEQEAAGLLLTATGKRGCRKESYA